MQAIIKTGGLIPPTLFFSKTDNMRTAPVCLPPPYYFSPPAADLLRFAYVAVQTPAWLRVTVVGLDGLLAPVGVQVTVNVSGFIFVTDIVKSPD